jgi:LacI family transcriptional regulator
MRPRIGQVAQLAGVSATTVSHALSGRRPASEATRRRILEAFAVLDFPGRRILHWFFVAASTCR